MDILTLALAKKMIPFGETTVKGDTLTFDGNTEGLVCVDTGDSLFYLVADNVITADDLKGGFTTVDTYGDRYIVEYSEEVEEAITKFGGAFPMHEGLGFLIPTDNFVFMGAITFPKAGIYFGWDEYGGLISLTIPGYNGFTTTTIKPIDTKYLPEHLQFGTETKVVEGDTLVWDGDTDGHVVVEYPDAGFSFVKISDNVITEEDLRNGITVKSTYEETMTFSYDEIKDGMSGGGLVAAEGYFALSPYDNYSFMDHYTFPEAGVYAFWDGEDGFESLTIPNYTGFVSEQTTVKPMDEKYMPILTSPSGKKFKLSVSDSGAVTATEV